MAGALAVALAVVWSAGGADAAVTDLTPGLAHAEVCASNGSCWPRETSASLHQQPGDADAVRLPLRLRSRLHLRVPAAARLGIDFEAVASTLTVAIEADGSDESVVLTAGPAEAGRWRHAEVDLAPWAGRVTRIVLRAVPVPGGAAASCRVRRLDLERPATAAGGVGSFRSPARRPNVLLYVIDTVRADRLGCYGYPRPTTPRIDRFRTSALLFADAVAQSSWTLSSTASILTGMTPRHHGAVGEGIAIRPDVPTLAERLAPAGYRSAGFSTNFLASATFGHARGFDTFRLYDERPKRRRGIYLPSNALVRRVIRWLAHPPQPFFLYVHATDPHWPYVPPRRYLRPFRRPSADGLAEQRVIDAAWPFFFGNARWGERRSALADDQLGMLRDLYDGELRFADDFFGRLVDALAARGLLDDTLVVLTSDHGEEFQDHGGLAHGQTLYHEVVHVPLIVRLPGGAAGGSRIETTVQHVDIVPTVLQVAGLAAPAGLDGRSLLASRDPPEDEAYSFLALMGAALESVTGPQWKVIRRLRREDPGNRRLEAYDRGVDPDEQHDVAPDAPVLSGYGTQRLDELGAEAPPGPSVDPQQLERLRALGYVQD